MRKIWSATLAWPWYFAAYFFFMVGIAMGDAVLIVVESVNGSVPWGLVGIWVFLLVVIRFYYSSMHQSYPVNDLDNNPSV